MEQFRELYEKSKKIIDSCQNAEQANVASNFIEISHKLVIMSLKTPKNKKNQLKNRLFTIIINDDFNRLKQQLNEKFQ